MKLLLTKIAILTGCLTMSACVFSDSPEKAGPLTKEDAKRIANPGEDLCDIYNWYGDGECDMFCENADPDCNIQCDGVPVCADGFYEVEACHSGSECRDVSLCGTTIQCQAEEIYCLASGLSQPYSTCDLGYEIVEECLPNPAGGDCYEVAGFCGGPSVFCQKPTSDCEIYPTCPSNSYQTEECLDGDQECFEESACNYTIYCTRDVFCNDRPVCPPDMVEVEACDPATDVQCFEETLCGTTISCRSVELCDYAVGCPADYVEVESCPSDSNCYEKNECGQTTSCMKTTVNCLAYPTCPADSKEVAACDPNQSCSQVSMCGVTITCQAVMF